MTMKQCRSFGTRSRFRCLDCKVDTGKISEYYMLKDEIWLNIFPSKFGMLCVGCAEARLGRQLAPADFNDSYLNKKRTVSRSMRLADRLGMTR